MNSPDGGSALGAGLGAGSGATPGATSGATTGATTRIDVALVHQTLARSRGHARDLISGGAVLLDGVPVRRRSATVRPGQRLDVRADGETGPAWVGRAAGKLEHAFQTWRDHGLSADGRRCLDVGASTGGFTQVLVNRGARRVVALDVGHDQLAAPLRGDPRVVDRAGTNIRFVDPAELTVAAGGPIELVVADLSFISLRLVLPSISTVLCPGGQAVLLVKPQFEVGRERLGRTGVVADPADRLGALLGVIEAVAEIGLSVHDLVHSPIRGGRGNHEYLLWVSAVAGDDPGPRWVPAPVALSVESARSQAVRLVAQEVEQ